MIIDDTKNWQQYFPQEWAKTAFSFLETLTVDTEDGEYPLMGEQLFAKVLSYKTKSSHWITESHREYVDIQILLAGEEMMQIFDPSMLEIKKPYEPAIDCVFYHLPKQKPLTRIYLTPGKMGVFFPQDAHTTQMPFDNQPKTLKKVVFKVHRTLFNL